MGGKKSELTAEDISNAVRIFFSNKGIKLFKNEPHKRIINGRWVVLKDLGFPPGSPDLMGWAVHTGKTYGVEIKTINDTRKIKQKNFHKIMINDNCEVYQAKELVGKKIELFDYRSEQKYIINYDSKN